MAQRRINENVDYLYGLQRDETAHQDHRLSWIIAAQALIFTGLCTLIGEDDYTKTVVITLILMIGVLLSLSGVYSVIVGEASNSVVMETWDEYDHRKPCEVNKLIPHLVILTPSYMLRSRWQFLLFCRFAPNVFCAAWIVLLFEYLKGLGCISFGFDAFTKCEIVAMTVVYYLIVICLLCIITHTINVFQRHKYVYERRHEINNNCKRKKKRYDDCSRCHSRRSFSCCYKPTPNNRRYTAGNGNLRIYHILIDRFNGNWTAAPANKEAFIGGTLAGVTDKLDYIQSLGYNTILLTPIHATNAYHGYHVTDYKAVDPHFGDWADFEALIKAAHKRRMKLLCDFVPNHCHISNPLFQDAQKDVNSVYRDWFYFDSSRKGGFVSYQNYPDLPKFNLYNQAAADYMIGIAVDLIKRGVDGLRIDHAVGVPFTFLKRLRMEAKKANRAAFVFGEVWATSPRDVSQIEFKSNSRKQELLSGAADVQEMMQLDYAGVLDGVLDFEFMNIMVDEVSQGKRFFGNKSLKHRLNRHFCRYNRDFTPILFLDNHDTNRFMFYCNNDTTLLDEAVEYMKSLPYPSIVYYGTEQYMENDLSIDNGRDYADLDVREPMDWN